MKTNTLSRYKQHNKKVTSIANTAINRLCDHIDNPRYNFYGQTTDLNIQTSTDLLAYHLLQQSLAPSQRSTLLDALDHYARHINDNVIDACANKEEINMMQKTLTTINQLERLYELLTLK